MPRLGVNIDHVATLRQARYKGVVKTKPQKLASLVSPVPEPSPLWAAVEVELAGAHGITVHLREDRRHIQDQDVYLLRKIVRTSLNLEMANVPEIVNQALQIHPDEICLVPEKRQEVTTEGGLDVLSNKGALKKTIQKFKKAKIRVSLFIDPKMEQVQAAKEVGADTVELHTGLYASSMNSKTAQRRIETIAEAAKFAEDSELQINAGHGLGYENVQNILIIPQIHTLNIGHSIISRSLFIGLRNAVREMVDLISSDRARTEIS